jgi:hypothetical protein
MACLHSGEGILDLPASAMIFSLESLLRLFPLGPAALICILPKLASMKCRGNLAESRHGPKVTF